MHIITCDCHAVTEKTKQQPQTCLNCMLNQIPIVLLAKLPCWWAKKTLLIVWQPFNLGLVKNGWIDSIRDCSCANSTNNNTHNKACCNVYANVFPPVTMDRNVDVAALFGAAKATICRVLPVLFDMDCRQVSWSNPSNYTAYPNHSWSR